MTDAEIRGLAELIADDLFTNGNGDRGDRLVMVQEGNARDLGGWCRNAVVDRVVTILTANRGVATQWPDVSLVIPSRLRGAVT